MLSITINNQLIDTYLAGYDVVVEKIYDQNLNYTAVDGSEVKNLLGVQRVLTVKFEPMNTYQINELFNSIGIGDVVIEYIDPMDSTSTVERTFTCEQLPVASYFESDDGIDFWTIPDIEFKEAASSWRSAS